MAADGRVRRIGRRIPFVVGVVAILALVNVAAGAVYDRATGRASEPVAAWSPLGRPQQQADRLATPAMAGRPWTVGYGHELAALRYRYETFLTYDQLDHRGRYVNVVDGRRSSWSAPGPVGSRPVVSVNGGSLAFGVGQRDDHTVASELARLAAADGVPIEVVNAGRPGWTSWQSTLGFERDLASEHRPDLAVFLGGLEDLTGQPNPDGRLSFADLPGLQSAVLGRTPAERRWDDIRDGYVRLSVVNRAARWAGLGAERSGSAPAAPLVVAPAQGRDGARAHARAWAIARGLGADAGVTTRSYWQPLLLADRSSAARRVALLGPGTVDLSGLLRGRPGAFVDPGDVDETGARTIARRIWTDLRPDVERWYRSHPAPGG